MIDLSILYYIIIIIIISLLPLKVGCSLMTLSYYNDEPNSKLCIIPVGLHYSKPFEFRSEVCVVFGDPIYPSKQIQEKYINIIIILYIDLQLVVKLNVKQFKSF